VFIENMWYCAGLSSELQSGLLRRVICNEPIVFYRDLNGGPVALEDRCSHRHAPLSKGSIHGDNVQCNYHGLMFDRTGMCVHIPHQNKIPPRAHIRAHAVEEKWGYVWVWRGQSEDADPDLIPDLNWNVDPKRSPVYAYFYVKANFQLVADNLLDVSHADYLHATSFGSKSGSMDGPKPGDYEFDSWVKGEKVYSVRKLKNVEVGDLAKKWGGFTKKLDRTNEQMWEAPNTVHIRLEMANEENQISVHHDNIMTPETETTTHFFFNFTRDFGVDGHGYPTDEDIYNELYTVISTEDMPMLEAQQENIELYGNTVDMPVEADRLLNGVHRLLTRMYKERGIAVPGPLARSERKNTNDNA